jgi:hypothetical protein
MPSSLISGQSASPNPCVHGKREDAEHCGRDDEWEVFGEHGSVVPQTKLRNDSSLLLRLLASGSSRSNQSRR